MAAKIKRKHFPMLEKLSQLFFETQTLQATRYMLLPQTKLKDLKNYIMAFSDGSLHFSTSCIYFVSCDRNSDRCHSTLINTMSKLAEDTKINKTEESIPAKEMHGLWLAVSNMLRLIKDIQETQIPIEAAYIGVDALSQIVGLTRPPHVLKPKLC